MFDNLFLYCDGNDVKEATALDGIIKKIRSRELSETGTFWNGYFIFFGREKTVTLYRTQA